MVSEPRAHLLYAAWVVALVGTLVSLFFSEVMKLVPCALCWYQRIFLYPLVVILPVGILLRDAKVTAYALPLAAIGLAFAVYHNLIYYGVIPETLSPCTQGVPCTSRQIDWFGFVSIPLMGLAAFLLVIVCLLIAMAREKRERARP